MQRPAPPPRYRFGLFELDPEAAELRRSGRRLPLQDLPLRLLHELLKNPGELVTRDQLRQALWPPDVHVDFDGSLNAAVRRVREALGDSARDSRFVETVPKRGYRFLAPVTAVDAAPRTSETATTPRPDAAPAPAPAEAPNQAPIQAQKQALARSNAGSRAWPLLLATLLGLVVWIATVRFTPPSELPQTPVPLTTEAPDLPRRLAVLPLEIIGEDERLVAIAAGLTDELIVHLGGLAPQELVVVAPTSVRRAQAEDGDWGSMAARLDVRFLLAGTLRVEGDRLRVAARLVEAAPQTVMWTTSLDGRLGSLLDVERSLATRLGDGLRRELLGKPGPVTLRAGGGTRGSAGDADLEPRAYEHYLRARHYLARQTPEGFQAAERELQRAIELEPGFADAWAALATTRALIGIYDLERPRDVFPRAEAALERASSLAPSNTEALVASAVIEGAFHWRLGRAEAALRRALAQSPQHVEARRWLGLLLQSQGKTSEAQAQLALARSVDPLSLTLLTTIEWCHFLAGELDRAIAVAHDILELDGDYLVAWDDLKWFHTVAGREAEAAEAFFKVVELEGDGHAVPGLRQLYARQGFRRGLLEESLANHLRAASEPGYHSPYDIAITQAALGRVEPALDWLERSFDEREVDMLGLAHDPRLDPLRGQPRFTDLLERFQAAGDI